MTFYLTVQNNNDDV